MGLAGGIVRKVLSKSPCHSGAVRSRNEKNSVDHKSRWSSLRLNLCGDEFKSAPEEDDAASVKSFETALVQPVTEASGEEQSNNAIKSVESEEGITKEDGTPTKSSDEEDAAIFIQSAFRGFLARKQLKETKRCAERERIEEPKSPTSASISASVEVQVGESLSNLRLSEDSVTVQHRANQRTRLPTFRVKEGWDDSTVSSNISKLRIQSRIEATTRRERAMAYAFSQQLRSCNTKKRSARSDQSDFNVGWSWLERWMATRQLDNSTAEDCLSKNADSASMGRRVIVIKKRYDFAVEEKESCGSNEVSVSFDGSTDGMSCYKPVKNRLNLKSARKAPRRKVPVDRSQTRSNKVSKKLHQREEVREGCKQEQQKDQTEIKGPWDCQPPTDY